MEEIKRYREKNGISQKEIAESLGVCQQSVAKWETGAAKPRADKLPALAKLLHCTVDQLLED